jgi:hypothetical protein
MAKSFNFTLFFKKNENALLFVGLALIVLFVFGVNADVMGAIQIFRKEPEVEEVKRIGGGCQLIEGLTSSQSDALDANDLNALINSEGMTIQKLYAIMQAAKNHPNVKAHNSPNRVVNNEVRYRDKSGEMQYGDDAQKAIKSRGKES